MQQNYGKVAGVSETIAPVELMEDALSLYIGALARHEVIVEKEFEQVAAITVDKHKVLQILLNFINNAKHACRHSEKQEKVIILRIYLSSNERLCFEVEDNGIGIEAGNLTKIFQHGFTTKKTGHGFGLHSGAIAAKELGGKLAVRSDGPEKGAVFTLELPVYAGAENDKDE